MALDTGKHGIDAAPSADLQRPARPEDIEGDGDGAKGGYSRREALVIGRDIGALVLAACAGLRPALRQKNPFAEKLTEEEAEALEKLYAALEKLDRYIENFARDVAKMNADKMTIEEAELLELRLNAIKELLDGGLAVKVQFSGHRENFDQAVNYLRQTAMRDLAEKFTVVARRVRMITESVYMKQLAVLTDDNFEKEVLKDDGVYIVMLTADWCSACHSALPLTAKFERKRVAGVKIGRAVLEDGGENIVNPRITRLLRPVMEASGRFGYPAYVMFVEGKPVGFTVGTMGSLEGFGRLIERGRGIRRRDTKEKERRIPPPIPEPDDDMPPPVPEPDDDMPQIRPGEPLIKV